MVLKWGLLFESLGKLNNQIQNKFFDKIKKYPFLKNLN